MPQRSHILSLCLFTQGSTQDKTCILNWRVRSSLRVTPPPHTSWLRHINCMQTKKCINIYVIKRERPEMYDFGKMMIKEKIK